MAASRMCHGVTKSGSPTPSEITSGIAWTMSKNSRMPERGMLRTWRAMNCCGWNGAAMPLPSQTENHRREKEKTSVSCCFCPSCRGISAHRQLLFVGWIVHVSHRIQNWVHTHDNIAQDDARFVDQVSDGGGEHGVETGDFPS